MQAANRSRRQARVDDRTHRKHTNGSHSNEKTHTRCPSSSASRHNSVIGQRNTPVACRRPPSWCSLCGCVCVCVCVVCALHTFKWKVLSSHPCIKHMGTTLCTEKIVSYQWAINIKSEFVCVCVYYLTTLEICGQYVIPCIKQRATSITAG